MPNFYTTLCNQTILDLSLDFAKGILFKTMAKFNYRKFYEKEMEIELPEDWDVHHVDGNRANNSIENLIAIPKKLHQNYHTIKAKIDTIIKECRVIDDIFTPNEFCYPDYREFVNLNNEMLPLYNEISHYIRDKRAFLDYKESNKRFHSQFQ